MPRSQNFLRLSTLVLLAICLVGCGRRESYRYKLTLAVNTPEGVKRASNVVEVQFSGVSVPARGVMHDLNGEALYLDLGAGRRPLIISIVNQLHQRKDVRWSRDGGPSEILLAKLYGAQLSGEDLLEKISSISKARGSHKISPDDLPDILTFADVNVPGSVLEVDRHDLSATFGANVSWDTITLEITDEPITRDINSKLPWLRNYFEKNLRLDGSAYGSKNELANILSWSDFEQSRDLKRTR